MKRRNYFLVAAGLVLLIGCGGGAGNQAAPPTAKFRFISWSDSKDHPEILQSISVHAAPLNPAFTIFPGDLAVDAPPGEPWKTAINGGSSPGNGLFDRTFATRGNHDVGAAAWEAFFDFVAVAALTGTTKYSSLWSDETYSFDYGNSHFVAVEMPEGDVASFSQRQWEWLDQDVTAAEGRAEIRHVFLFWHGPLWPVGPHPSTPPAGLISILNAHPIIAASFHGHEHLQAYVHFDGTHLPGVAHSFEQFITGTTGASIHACDASKLRTGDWCESFQGFTAVDVDGDRITAVFYDVEGASRKGISFVHSAR